MCDVIWPSYWTECRAMCCFLRVCGPPRSSHEESRVPEGRAERFRGPRRVPVSNHQRADEGSSHRRRLDDKHWEALTSFCTALFLQQCEHHHLVLSVMSAPQMGIPTSETRLRAGSGARTKPAPWRTCRSRPRCSRPTDLWRRRSRGGSWASRWQLIFRLLARIQINRNFIIKQGPAHLITSALIIINLGKKVIMINRVLLRGWVRIWSRR